MPLCFCTITPQWYKINVKVNWAERIQWNSPCCCFRTEQWERKRWRWCQMLVRSKRCALLLRGFQCWGSSWVSLGSRPYRARGRLDAPPPSEASCQKQTQTYWCTRIWGRKKQNVLTARVESFILSDDFAILAHLLMMNWWMSMGYIFMSLQEYLLT